MKKEIEFIYNSKYSKDKEALAVLTSLSDHIINEKDVNKTQLTPRQLAQIANDLDVRLMELVDKQAEDYDDSLQNLSDDDLLETLHQNMHLLKTPIVKEEHETKFYDSSYTDYKRDLELNTVEREIK